MCLLISYAAAACSGSSTRCSLDIKPSTDYTERNLWNLWLLLSFNAIAVVPADGAVVAKAARLQTFRWVNTKITRSHPIEKLPNLRDDLRTNLLPILVRKERIPRAQL